jgi:hypothetical protein
MRMNRERKRRDVVRRIKSASTGGHVAKRGITDRKPRFKIKPPQLIQRVEG